MQLEFFVHDPKVNMPETNSHLVGAAEFVNRLNKALAKLCDKDWNYSRITLQIRNLDTLAGAYALWIDLVDLKSKNGRDEIRASKDEIRWGQHHSNELGILEIISLRVNHALFETTTDEDWAYLRPILRVVRKEVLVQKGITNAVWYVVEEVTGEDFESR